MKEIIYIVHMNNILISLCTSLKEMQTGFTVKCLGLHKKREHFKIIIINWHRLLMYIHFIASFYLNKHNRSIDHLLIPDCILELYQRSHTKDQYINRPFNFFFNSKIILGKSYQCLIPQCALGWQIRRGVGVVRL